MTRLHVLQHVPFEDAANIGVWAREQGWTVASTRLYRDETLPPPETIDWLAIMGGPMNIYEHERYPWLVTEKAWIKQVIEAGKTVIGVCLGAQLIADVLGGEVTRNTHTEIGWFPVTKTEAGRADLRLAGLPETFETFHWHGDSFSIPPGAVHLAASEACPNQIFRYGERVLGMQCHLDYSAASLQAMVEHCSDELIDAPFIQTDSAVLIDTQRAKNLKQSLYAVLDALRIL